MVKEYVGARYVPKFDGDWDNTKTYEPLTIVNVNNVGSYTSKKFVPVGVAITDTEYWALSGNLSGAIVNLQNQIDAIRDDTVIANVKTPEQFGAKGDGVTDDTAAIQACLDDGGMIVFKEGAIYRVDTAVSLKPIADTVIDMNGATIQAIPNAEDYYEVFMVEHVSNVTIKNGIIVGDRDSHLAVTGEWGNGIYVSDASHVFIENMDISACWGDGIYISEDSKDVKVDSNTLHYNRRQGLSVTYGSEIIIVNNLIRDTGGTAPGAGIDLEPNTNMTVKNVVVAHNIFIDNKYGIAVSGGAPGAVAEDIILDANMILCASSDKNQIQITAAKNVKITNNTIKATVTGDLLYINNAENYDIIGNTFINSSAFIAMLIGTSKYGHIANNFFRDITVSSDLIYLLKTIDNVLENNMIVDCETTAASEYCIYLAGDVSNPVENNVFIGNSLKEITFQYGFAFGNYANSNKFLSNDISGTYEYAAYTRVTGLTNNNFSFNDLSSGSLGAYAGNGGYGGNFKSNIIDNVFTA